MYIAISTVANNMFAETKSEHIEYPNYVSIDELDETEKVKIEELKKVPDGGYDLDFVAQCL